MRWINSDSGKNKKQRTPYLNSKTMMKVVRVMIPTKIRALMAAPLSLVAEESFSCKTKQNKEICQYYVAITMTTDGYVCGCGCVRLH